MQNKQKPIKVNCLILQTLRGISHNENTRYKVVCMVTLNCPTGIRQMIDSIILYYEVYSYLHIKFYT